MQQDGAKSWEAVLSPHRSLGRRGYLFLMGMVGAANLIVGLLFYVAGAWPVFGFAGLDVLLLWWALRANLAAAARTEHIGVTAKELTVERFVRSRPVERLSFVKGWVRVELEVDEERELVGRLSLVSSGRSTEIGEFLPPDEKREFARALKSALRMHFA